MNAESKTPTTLVQAVRYFSDPDTALGFFVPIRWPHGVRCPHCGSDKVSFLVNQRRWQCHTKHPRRQFSAKVGTIMEDSPLPLESWLVVIWLETSAKNSISSYEVARALGITQKSAWFMLHRVRLTLQSGSFEKMGGKGSSGVEVDETFIGGKARNMHAHRRAKKITGTGGSGKTAVMGLLDRHGPDKCSKVRTKVVENVRRGTLQTEVRQQVEPGTNVYTDALRSYEGLSAEFVHAVVDHAECYAKGNVHTNGLENFWSLFKRCIKGTHVSVEPLHLFRYLDSECFRFNNRDLDDGRRFMLSLQGVSSKRLTYKSLTGALEERLQSESTAGNAAHPD